MRRKNPTPFFLTVADVQRIHRVALRATGEAAQHCDLEKLEGILGAVGNYAHYESEDVLGLATVLAEKIALGHPFTDGNKRTALAAMSVFLETNHRSIPGGEQLAHLIEGLVTDRARGRNALLEWLQLHASFNGAALD